MSNQQIIELIRKGEHDKALDKLYDNYPAFKNSFVKNGGKQTDAEDIFQDALLIFIEKVSDREFMLTSSISTFLFGICRNLTLMHFRKNGKEVNLQFNNNEESCDFEITDKFQEREKKFAALDKILTTIGKKCMEILSLFYVSGLRMNEIAEKLGFKSETSVKTQKYKCIEKAKKLSERVLVELQTELS